MPAVQLAELLAELADIEADVAGEAGPVGIALLHAHCAALETHENLGVRIRVEGRLESDLELARIEVVTLHAWGVPVRPHGPGDADSRVEPGLIALAADELRRHGGVGALRRITARGGRGGAERRKIVARRSEERRPRPAPTHGRHDRVEASPEEAERCPRRGGPALGRVL